MVFCFEDDGVDKASQLMAQHQIRRLPVMSSTKRLVGIVTWGMWPFTEKTQKRVVMCCSRSPFLLVPTADCLSDDYLKEPARNAAPRCLGGNDGGFVTCSEVSGAPAHVRGKHCEERQVTFQDSQCKRFVAQYLRVAASVTTTRRA